MATKLPALAALTLALTTSGPLLAFDRIGPRPVVIGDVAYLPSMETRREGDSAVLVRATIRAVDVRTDRELWSIPLRADGGDPPTGLDLSKESAIRFMTRFERGFLARTEGAVYYVDPLARTSRPVKDDRGPAKPECALHHRAMEEGLVPIRYGLGAMEPGRPEDRARLFPNAHTVVNAGCLVREAKLAAVHYCPDCREAARVSATRPEDPTK